MNKIKFLTSLLVIGTCLVSCGPSNFTVTFNSNGGTPIESQIVNRGDKVTEPDDPTKTGYTFNNWQYKGSDWSFEEDLVNADMTLDATWNIITYSISYELDGGNQNESNPKSYTIEDSKTLYSPTKTGYSFSGWYKGTEKVTEIVKGIYGDITLTAHWSINSYKVTVTSQDASKGTVSGEGTYEYKSSVTIVATPNAGYSFEGWYLSSEKVSSSSSYSFNMPSSDVSYEARWTTNKYNVTVLSTDTTKGTVSESGSYDFNSNVTVTATPLTDCLFKGWYTDSELTNKVSTEASYSFTMLDNDVTLYGRFWTNEEEEKWNIAHGVIPTITADKRHITYGMYPQTYINNSSLAEKLNTLTNPNEQGYYCYKDEYYFKYLAQPCQTGYTFDKGGLIVRNTYYWFKVEPILWKILANEDDTYFLTTESLLTNYIYANSFEGTESKTDYQGNTATVYANNYKYSEVRNWLNTTFYKQAFFLDEDNINISEVDNSVESTGFPYNEFACENTNDKLFLLSIKELTTSSYGFSISSSYYDSARKCKATDYSKAHGIRAETSYEDLNLASYYVRSPGNSSSTYGSYTYIYGFIYSQGLINLSDYGIRPALRLKL